MSDYLLRGAITNAVNFPSISAEEAPKLKPFVALAEKLGSFAGQLTETGISKVQIAYRGRGGADEHQGAHLGGARRAAAADARRRQRRLGAGRRQGARHRRRGGHARDAGGLREPDHGDGHDRDSRRATSPARCSPTAARASSTSRASAWTPSSAPSMIYITNLDKPGFIGKFSVDAGRGRHQHRDLPRRPRGAGRQRRGADRDRRRIARRGARQGARAAAGAAGQAAAFLKKLSIVNLLTAPSGRTRAALFACLRGHPSFIRGRTWPVAPGLKCPGAVQGSYSWPTSWWSAPSGATRARARSSTGCPSRPTSSSASRAAITPATRWSSATPSTSCRCCRPAWCARASCRSSATAS